MTRPRALPVVQRAAGPLPRRRTLPPAPPSWGDRRGWAERRVVEHLPVPKNRGRRLMRAPGLLVPPNVQLQAKRTPTGSPPRPLKPHEWWGIAMTEGLGPGGGGAARVGGLEGATTAVVGAAAGRRWTTPPRRQALARAVHRPCPQGARGQGVALRSAHGGQPPAHTLMEACSTWGIPQAWSSDHTPQGTADPERVMRPLTENGLGRQDWTCPVPLMTARAHGITYDNAHALPSASGYVAPRPFARDDHNRHGSPFVAA
jgi:putative transposase